MHSEHPKIKQFFPLVTESLTKRLRALSNGDTSYEVPAIEVYAQEVFSRVSEIDNAFKNMSIAVEHLKKTGHPGSGYSFSEHHAFHIENFLLRLTGVVDRSYLLAGSTMLMENSKIEKFRGKRTVHKELQSFSPFSVEILNRMEGAIDHLRTPRNKVAHQAGFSSKNLSVLQTIENSELDSISVRQIKEIMSYEKIKDIVIEESVDQFDAIIPIMDGLVKELIDSLSFVYDGFLQMHITSQGTRTQ